MNNNFNKNYNKKKQETEKQNLSSDDINFNIMQINLKFDISQRKNNKNKILYKKPHIKKKIFKKKEENPENANIDEEEDSDIVIYINAAVAQLVERRTENPYVVGPIPTCGKPLKVFQRFFFARVRIQ